MFGPEIRTPAIPNVGSTMCPMVLDQLKSRKEVEQTPLISELTDEWIDYKFNDPNKDLSPDTLRQIWGAINSAGHLSGIHELL